MPGSTEVSSSSSSSSGPESRDVMSEEELAKVAELELNETPASRRQGLDDLRNWIGVQGGEYGCLRGASDEFLLRFLRVGKMNPKRASAVLKNYLSARTNSPSWFRTLDIRDPRLNELISSGYIFVLPERDSVGRRVIFSRAASLDGSKFNSCDIMRAHFVTYEALLLEEECQINGLTYVFDEEGVNWSHVSMWTPSSVGRAFASTEGALPLRHREMNFVNLPWTMALVFKFAKSLLSPKLRQRLHTHPSFDAVKEFVPERILPSEYGGQTPLDEMVSRWKAVLEERRPHILALQSVKLGR